MAQKVQITLVDDIDGSEATETIRFALDGTGYEIDLNDNHAAELRDALEKYTRAGRRASAGTTGRASRGSASAAARSSRAELDALRTWARENGYKVADRGRVSQEIRDAYAAAH